MNEAVATAEETTAPKGPTVIAAVNPSAEEMKGLIERIQENYDFSVDTKPVIFRFKKSKDKDTGLETVRQPVELALPFPSVEGIVHILEGGGKGLELLQEAIEGVIIDAARSIIADDTSINAANFPVDKVSWEAIANQPKAQRRGGGIPKEDWEAFLTDYAETMVPATGKTPEQIGNACNILGKKFASVKTNQPVLELLVEQLGVYAEHTANLEEHKACVEFLLNKADQLLNVSEEELLSAL